jgi:hypothetical protein
MPPALPHEGRGLIRANRPWTGSYHINPLTWVLAQTTQLTRPGWRYVGGADHALRSPGRGSYVTYQAPDHSAWSMVVQTAGASARQSITVHITGGLPRAVVHVWATSLHGGSQFTRLADIAPHRGTFSRTLSPGYVYTFTTTSGQSKAGGAQPRTPAASPMPLPYTAAPDGSSEASMLSAMEGSFEYRGGVLTQTAVGQPVEWRHPGAPGVFTVDRGGAWRHAANGPSPVVLASGTVPAASFYRLELAVHGTTLRAALDGIQVASVSDSRYRSGPAGLGALGYYPVQYGSFSVR